MTGDCVMTRYRIAVFVPYQDMFRERFTVAPLDITNEIRKSPFKTALAYLVLYLLAH